MAFSHFAEFGHFGQFLEFQQLSFREKQISLDLSCHHHLKELLLAKHFPTKFNAELTTASSQG